MYQALYRKYRPLDFEDVVGQDQVTTPLRRQIISGRTSHAYIFVGTRGTGKTTCAKILSRAINCENPVNGNPCNRCPSCLGILDGSVMDVEEIDAASNNGVDNVRTLREDAMFTPVQVKKRVYIIDEVHMLSTSAFNALLKILEEPPEHIVFILATTELRKVPATILSRCQRYQFRRIGEKTISERLKYVAAKENIALTDSGAATLARFADGSMRDALSLLDQCAGEGTVDDTRINDIVGLMGTSGAAQLYESVSRGDAAGALETVDELWREGKDMAAVLSELSDLMRDALIFHTTKNIDSTLLSGFFDKDLVTSCAKSMGVVALNRGIDCLQATIAEMSRSGGRKLSAEMCMLRLCNPVQMGDTSALEARIEKLERALASGILPAAPAAQDSARTPAANTAVAPKPAAAPAQRPQPAPRPVETAPVQTAAPAPERQSAPAIPAQTVAQAQTAAVNPTGAEGGAWNEIFESAKPALPRLARRLLANSMETGIRIDGRIIYIDVYGENTIDYIDRDDVKKALSAPAEQTMGGAVTIIVRRAEAPKQAEQNIDTLANMLRGFGMG